MHSKILLLIKSLEKGKEGKRTYVPSRNLMELFQQHHLCHFNFCELINKGRECGPVKASLTGSQKTWVSEAVLSLGCGSSCKSDT